MKEVLLCSCGDKLYTQRDKDLGVCTPCRTLIDEQMMREDDYEDHSYYPEENEEKDSTTCK